MHFSKVESRKGKAATICGALKSESCELLLAARTGRAHWPRAPLVLDNLTPYDPTPLY